MAIFGFPARAWLAAFSILALASCGGSSGSSGATGTGSTGLTPAATQASVSELADAFASTLTGAQEVPARPSGATGSGTVVINPVTRQMTATLTTTGIAGTDAHIHQAPAGVNGPIIFPLVETVRGSGIWIARATVTDVQLRAFRAGDFYFNVHSTNFADGEIRGQILSQQPGSTTTVTTDSGTTTNTTTNTGPSTGTTNTGTGLNPFVASTATFLAALRGSQEVPPTPSSAQGAGTVLVNPANRQIIAAVTTVNIAGTAAHIHEAPAGTSGPIIIPLREAVSGSGIWTAGAVLTEAQFSALQAGNLYLNVHSSAFPNGEIRGQILPQTISLESITGAAGRLGNGTTTTTNTGSNPMTTTSTVGNGMTITTGSGAMIDTGTTATGTPGTTGITGTPAGITGTPGMTGTNGRSGGVGFAY